MSTSFFRSSRPAGQVLLVTPRHCLSAALVIFVLMVGIGALPGNALAMSTLVYDKALHLIAYAFLSGLLYAGLSGGLLSRAMRTLLVVGLFGAADEAIQAWLPYRTANWIDWEVDMLAAIFIVTVAGLLHRLHRATANKNQRDVGPDRPASLY